MYVWLGLGGVGGGFQTLLHAVAVSCVLLCTLVWGSNPLFFPVVWVAVPTERKMKLLTTWLWGGEVQRCEQEDLEYILKLFFMEDQPGSFFFPPPPLFI